MAENEENSQDWSGEEEGMHFPTSDEIHKLYEDAVPLVEEFFKIYGDIQMQDPSLILAEKGVRGAIGHFVDGVIPPVLIMTNGVQIIELAQRCVLFGYVLDQILKTTNLEELSTDDLEKLWNIGQEEEEEKNGN